jgi:YVTN family beta-propeller protein
MTPDGKTLFAVGTNEVLAVDTTTRAVGYIPVGQGTSGIAIAPDGKTAYVTNMADDSVTPIDVATLTAKAPITGVTEPLYIALTPDGTTAYVTQVSHAVTPINLLTNTPGPPIPVAHVVTISIAPDQAPVAALMVTPHGHGTATRFDASASHVQYGSITRYAWTFGDGTKSTTTTATTTHTYSRAGTYTATVTETDSAGTSTEVIFTGQAVTRNGGPSAKATHMFVVS